MLNEKEKKQLKHNKFPVVLLFLNLKKAIHIVVKKKTIHIFSICFRLRKHKNK